MHETASTRPAPDSGSSAPVLRPIWDEWAVGIAEAVAIRADCSRRQVGAVVMGPDMRILATGYNGAPAGAPGCLTEGACPRGQLSYDQVAAGSAYVDVDAPCIALHAEENAVLHTPASSRVGATIFITCAPCSNCQRFLAGSGLVAAVWRDVETGELVRLVLGHSARQIHHQ